MNYLSSNGNQVRISSSKEPPLADIITKYLDDHTSARSAGMHRDSQAFSMAGHGHNVISHRGVPTPDVMYDEFLKGRMQQNIAPASNLEGQFREWQQKHVYDANFVAGPVPSSSGVPTHVFDAMRGNNGPGRATDSGNNYHGSDKMARGESLDLNQLRAFEGIPFKDVNEEDEFELLSSIRDRLTASPSDKVAHTLVDKITNLMDKLDPKAASRLQAFVCEEPVLETRNLSAYGSTNPSSLESLPGHMLVLDIIPSSLEANAFLPNVTSITARYGIMQQLPTLWWTFSPGSAPCAGQVLRFCPPHSVDILVPTPPTNIVLDLMKHNLPGLVASVDVTFPSTSMSWTLQFLYKFTTSLQIHGGNGYNGDIGGNGGGNRRRYNEDDDQGGPPHKRRNIGNGGNSGSQYTITNMGGPINSNWSLCTSRCYFFDFVGSVIFDKLGVHSSTVGHGRVFKQHDNDLSRVKQLVFGFLQTYDYDYLKQFEAQHLQTWFQTSLSSPTSTNDFDHVPVESTKTSTFSSDSDDDSEQEDERTTDSADTDHLAAVPQDAVAVRVNDETTDNHTSGKFADAFSKSQTEPTGLNAVFIRFLLAVTFVVVALSCLTIAARAHPDTWWGAIPASLRYIGLISVCVASFNQIMSTVLSVHKWQIVLVASLPLGIATYVAHDSNSQLSIRGIEAICYAVMLICCYVFLPLIHGMEMRTFNTWFMWTTALPTTGTMIWRALNLGYLPHFPTYTVPWGLGLALCHYMNKVTREDRVPFFCTLLVLLVPEIGNIGLWAEQPIVVMVLSMVMTVIVSRLSQFTLTFGDVLVMAPIFLILDLILAAPLLVASSVWSGVVYSSFLFARGCHASGILYRGVRCLSSQPEEPQVVLRNLCKVNIRILTTFLSLLIISCVGVAAHMGVLVVRIGKLGFDDRASMWVGLTLGFVAWALTSLTSRLLISRKLHLLPPLATMNIMSTVINRDEATDTGCDTLDEMLSASVTDDASLPRQGPAVSAITLQGWKHNFAWYDGL